MVHAAGIASVGAVGRHETKLPIPIFEIEAQRGHHERRLCVGNPEVHVDVLAGKQLEQRINGGRIADSGGD
jgi:hypothetical protein